MGSTQGLRVSAVSQRPAAAPVRLQTECAASRAKKSETLERLKKKFDPETALFVAGVNYKGMTVCRGRRQPDSYWEYTIRTDRSHDTLM